MFEQATATADSRHRGFFDRSGEVRQVWARKADGTLFYLADGAINDEVRAAARAGRLTCPYPDCPDPRFIAKGGSERRHHFAHQVAGQEHRTAAAWRHQALLMLADWTTRRYPHLEVELDDREEGESLRLHSPRTGRVVRLTVTYDRRYELPTPAPGEQLLLGHSRALLLPRREADGAPARWWCGEGRLVGDLIAGRGWALAVNPQERLVATIADGDLAREASLIQGRRGGGLLLCVVDELEHARLDADGLHTLASDALDEALERRCAADAELARRLKEAEARDRERRRAQEAERERRLAEGPAPPPPRPTDAVTWPTRERGVAARLDEEQEWPRELEALRRLLGDDELARRLERPLSTDVDCDVPAAVWHLMAVLEARRRGDDPHPMAVRAAIVSRCGYSLTGAAIAAVLAVADRSEQKGDGR